MTRISEHAREADDDLDLEEAYRVYKEAAVGHEVAPVA